MSLQPGPNRPEYRSFASDGIKPYIFVFLAAFSVSMLFAMVTDHAWEDYYITYRASKNLATGNGLVFQPDQRIHTFTSPINVLLPALLSYLTGNRSDLLVLWLYRIISCLTLGTTAVLLLHTGRVCRLSFLPLLFLLAMVSVEVKIIDFSINGQEAAFMVLFLSMTLLAMTGAVRHETIVLGIGWAGLMWTRPDSFIFFGALALGFLLFFEPGDTAGSRKDVIKRYVRAGLLAVVLYLPWFGWTWLYYGTPIPHTVVAKSLNMAAFDGFELIRNLISFPFYSLMEATSVEAAFLPSYYRFGGWPLLYLSVYARCLGWMGAFYWCFPFGRKRIRAVSFAVAVGHFYLTHLSPYIYPWYLPPCTLMGSFVLASLLQQCLDGARALNGRVIGDRAYRQMILWIRVATQTALAVNLLITVASAYQLRIQQKVVESGHRQQIGLWLKQNAASPADTVFLECLGYIGYFSQLKMLDFPGLSSPEMVAVRKRLKDGGWSDLIYHLKPDWVVLRPGEAMRVLKENPDLLRQTYRHLKTFDVTDRLRSYPFLPGRNYLQYDQTFWVFHRN